MVVIALLLLVVVVAVVVFVVVSGSTGTVTLEWDQMNLFFQPSPLVLFLLGAATLLLAVVAIAMFRAGSRRGMAKRRELKRLRKLDEEQGGRDHSRPGPTTAAPGSAPPAAASQPAPQHTAPSAPPVAPQAAPPASGAQPTRPVRTDDKQVGPER